MSRSQAEIGELVARIYDRLESEEFGPDTKIEDAMLLVEITDPEETIDLGEGRKSVPATQIMLEGTSDRLTIQAGIIEFAAQSLSGEVIGYPEAEEDD